MSTASRIYNQLLKGSSINPGLPPTLAAIMTAQAAYETAGFTSNVFKTCNNAFGYKEHGDEPACTQSPEGNAYAYYTSVEKSAEELVNYVYRRVRQSGWPPLNTITTPEQYATLITAAGYHGITASKYAAGVRAWLSKLDLKTVAIASGSLLVTAALIFVGYKILKNGGYI